MNNKNLPLIVAVVLPLVFIGILSLVVFLPVTSIKPQYNFLYSGKSGFYDGGYYGYKNTYGVKNGMIELEHTSWEIDKKNDNRKDAPDLFLYDVKNDSSREITFEEAKKFQLDPGPSSPDGYNVGYENGHYGIFEIFGSNDSNRGYFVSKGKAKKRLSGISYDNNYFYDFAFIGWVK